MPIRIREQLHPYLLGTGLLCFLVFKLMQLDTAYYWDEAYPYSYAIQHLYENGPSIQPQSVPPDLSTGHPLLFYFLQSAWMRLVGEDIFLARLFPLLLSVLMVLMTYLTGKKLLHPLAGLTAALLLMAQSVFLAQSSFALPETLLGLLSLVALYSYLSDKTGWYLLAASLLVLTKESGAVPALLIPAFDLVYPGKKDIRRSLLHCVPLLVMLGYYTLQKLQLGWFLYPRHLGYVSFDIARSFQLFSGGYGAFLWVYFGRVFISIAFAVCLWIYPKRFKDETPDRLKTVLLFSFFILGLWAFSSINFYSPRYILALFPFWLLLFGYFLTLAWKKKAVPVLLCTLLLTGTSITYAALQQTDGDHNLGYRNAALVQQEAVAYCAASFPPETPIYTHFLMEKNLQSPHIGYLPKGSPGFTNVHNSWNDSIQVIAIASNEAGLVPGEFKDRPGFRLEKEFRRGQAWVKIWVRNP